MIKFEFAGEKPDGYFVRAPERSECLNRTFKDVAREMDVNPQTISDCFHRVKYREIE